MGRLFLREFDQPSPDYYMCRLCRTPIAVKVDRIYTTFEITTDGVRRSRSVFRKVINVQIDEPIHYRRVAGHTKANVYCVKCGYKLGRKYIEARARQTFVKSDTDKAVVDAWKPGFGRTFMTFKSIISTAEKFMGSLGNSANSIHCETCFGVAFTSHDVSSTKSFYGVNEESLVVPGL